MIIAGTSILGALVIVLDYAMKFSGLKIPFPWLLYLKFDFTGIPIFLSLALFGLPSAAATAAVAFFAIVARSGNFISASMKMLAEFSTVLGAAIFLRRNGVLWKGISAACSLTTRVVVMSFFNMIVFGLGLGDYIVILLTAAFNVMQGSISFFGGYTIYILLKIRLPSIA